MNKPLITIGIISYNSLNTIKEAIDCALKQTWQPLEILIVDDCSTDGTWDALLDSIVKNTFLRIFRNEANEGVAKCRNIIIEESKGDFIAFFDDDDISLPERVAAQYLRIIDYENNYSNGKPVICHTARRLIYPNGYSYLESTIGQNEGKSAPSGISVALRILLGRSLEDGYGSCATCSQMARVSTYKLVGFFDENLRRSEDTDLNIRLSKLGSHFVGISNPLVLQRMTKTEEKNLSEEYRNFKLLILKHKELIENHANFDFCELFIEIKFAWYQRRYISFLLILIYLQFRYPIMTIARFFLAVKNFKSNLLFRKFHV